MRQFTILCVLCALCGSALSQTGSDSIRIGRASSGYITIYSNASRDTLFARDKNGVIAALFPVSGDVNIDSIFGRTGNLGSLLTTNTDRANYFGKTTNYGGYGNQFGTTANFETGLNCDDLLGLTPGIRVGVRTETQIAAMSLSDGHFFYNSTSDVFQGIHAGTRKSFATVDSVLSMINNHAAAPDTGSFSGSVTSDTVTATGAVAGDIVTVSAMAGAENTLPVAGDLINAYVITDKIIFNRAAGTTANLKYSYIWVHR